jgi:hypothetical protein
MPRKVDAILYYTLVDLPNAGMKPYVDPTNYSNAEEAVEEFANELDPRFIFLERLIGGGKFLFTSEKRGVHTKSANEKGK